MIPSAIIVNGEEGQSAAYRREHPQSAKSSGWGRRLPGANTCRRRDGGRRRRLLLLIIKLLFKLLIIITGGI